MPKVTLKQSTEAHKKLEQYRKQVNKAIKTSRASLNKMHAQLEKNIINTIDGELEMNKILELAKEITTLRMLLKKYQRELDDLTFKKYWEQEDLKEYEKNELDQEIIDQYTQEDIKQLPTSWGVADFFMVFTRLCDALTQDRVLTIFSEYAKKIVKNHTEFDRDTFNYAHAMYHFCQQYKENLFDMRDVRVWLAYQDQWEKFCIGALQQIRKEYLFDEIQLQLT